MTYNGALSGDGFIQTLDYSAAASKICAVYASGYSGELVPDSEVRIYETTYLSFQGTVALPYFVAPNGQGGFTKYNSEGHFGFFNAAGTAYYVLIKAEPGTGMLNEWAITEIKFE